MRNTTIVSILVSALAFTGCAGNHAAPAAPPPPPEFEAAAEPTPTGTPASEGRTTPIAPEDQVLFAFDSSVLDPTATKVLDDVVAWVKADPAHAVLIRGHADSSGTVAYNFDLSSRRAETVASYLYNQGVPKEQVALVAVGEDKAVLEPTDSNRRVVIYAIATGPAQAAR